jgi:hypothetical protein
MGQTMVNAALRVRLGSGPQGDGVRNVRSLIVVASLAALFAISSSSSGNAASVSQRANASYASSNSSQMSRAAEQPVPPNCIRQECGKLWCWQMGHK